MAEKKSQLYPDEGYSRYEESSPPTFSGGFAGKKKTLLIAVAVAIAAIALAAFMLLSPAPSPAYLSDSGGAKIDANVSLYSNGALIDSFLQDGTRLSQSANPKEPVVIRLRAGSIIRNPGSGTVTITFRGGQGFILPSEQVQVDANGDIIITINPEYDLDLLSFFPPDQYPDGVPDDTHFSFDMEIVLRDPVRQEDAIIEVPVELLFNEYAMFSGACLALSRASFSDWTHDGYFSSGGKLRLGCDLGKPLGAFVRWKSERMGNIEIALGTAPGTTLLPFPVPLLEQPSSGERSFTATFTPFTGYAGKKAQFDVVFLYAESEAPLVFNIAIENIEQCVKVTSPDSVIENASDRASITVDVSSCGSSAIEIQLCDKDPNCSGNTPEGGITPAQYFFTLNPKGSKSRTVMIDREEMPGIYGVTVHARVSGMPKQLIDEKEILVMPADESIVPDRFAVSLLGAGSKDSVRVRNKSLSEDVRFTASVCSIHTNSLALGQSVGGFAWGSANAGSGWWNDLAVNPKHFAGEGKYQASLMSVLFSADEARQKAQLEAYEKNQKIKSAYLFGANSSEPLESISENTELSSQSAEALRDKIKEANKFAQGEAVSKSLGLSQAILSVSMDAAMITDLILLRNQINSIDSASVSACEYSPTFAVSIPLGAAKAGVEQMYNESITLVSSIGQLVSLANQIYSISQSLKGSGEQIDETNAADALANVLASGEKIAAAQEKASALQEKLLAVLKSASIDSFVSAPEDHSDAKARLEEALAEVKEIQDDISGATTDVLNAGSNITLGLAEEPSKSDLWLQVASFLVSFIQMCTSSLTIVGRMGTELTAVSSLLSSANEAAVQAGITASSTNDTTRAEACTKIVPQITTAQTETGVLSGLVAAKSAKLLEVLSIANQLYGLLNSYQQMTNNYSVEFSQTQQYITVVADPLQGEVKSYFSDLRAAIEEAIPAADELSRSEERPAQGTDYSKDLSMASGDFDKKRLTGLLSTAVMNGYVNGAYEGGVYSTSSGFSSGVLSPAPAPAKDGSAKGAVASLASSDGEMKEDCSNSLQLTLPDYTTNLLSDAKSPKVSEDKIGASWSFEDPKVFGLFEEQEVGLVFSNSGLKKNGYAVVELPFDVHAHQQDSEMAGAFGPFDLADSSVQAKSYKYHFKVNAAPRKSSSTESSAICSMGILKGNTGEAALPRVIIGWDWNSVNPDAAEKYYLDASQFSILLGKKLSLINDFLERTSVSCPPNPALQALEAVTPSGIEFSRPQKCYIPMTTRYLEGKPALYYFLPSSAFAAPDSWGPEESISNADELMSALEFKALLMRDGYGTDFQHDFVHTYTSNILRASPSFLDPAKGAYLYFDSPKHAYYSSEAISLKPASEFVLPDAGLYRIRVIADFEEGTGPALITGGQLTGNLVYSLDLVQPIKENYSPFYYAPFDGDTGLNASNNRKSYGTSLSSGALPLVQGEGIGLESDQKSSLVRMGFEKIDKPSSLNALSSKRGKIMEFQYGFAGSSDLNSKITFSPTIATPLFMTIPGAPGEPAFISYALKSGENEVKVNANSLLQVTGVEGCRDFQGAPMTDTFMNTPDSREGSLFGIGFGAPSSPGIVHLKTIAYSPPDESYGLAFNGAGKIVTPNNQLGSPGTVLFEGITGMPYNDFRKQSSLSSVLAVFNAVKNKSVCVSRLGNKEIFWWPENYLYEKESSTGGSIASEENKAKAACIK